MAENGTNSEKLDAIVEALKPLESILTLLQRLDSKQQRPPRLMKIEEAMVYLCIGKGKLYELIRRGELPVVKIHEDNGHAPFLLDVQDLNSYIERQKS